MDSYTKGFVIEFNRQTFQSKDLRWQQLQSILDTLPSSPKLSPKLFGRIYSICHDAYLEFSGRELHFELFLLSKLISVLLLIHRENPTPITEPNSPLYESFLHLLEEHFREEHSVRFYSEQLGLTSKALTMRFHRLGVSSPRELIQDRCLIEAKRFLFYSSLTIQEIADRLGFDDPNYFARFFRTQARMSPGAFRSSAGRLC
ncbi:MAG: helix-turn-helix domain-containing protein [Proteobacteria bacterium]|nr:MAG: helix-turn-helix domain-containing protein [Pseudomonadota bacterium]